MKIIFMVILQIIFWYYSIISNEKPFTNIDNSFCNIDNQNIANPYNRFWYEYNRFNPKCDIIEGVNNKLNKVFTNESWLKLEQYSWELFFDKWELLISWIFWPDIYYYDNTIYIIWWENIWNWIFPIDWNSLQIEDRADKDWYSYEVIHDKDFYYRIIMYGNYYDKNEHFEIKRSRK